MIVFSSISEDGCIWAGPPLVAPLVIGLARIIGYLGCTPPYCLLSSRKWSPAVRAERDMEVVLLTLLTAVDRGGERASSHEL